MDPFLGYPPGAAPASSTAHGALQSILAVVRYPTAPLAGLVERLSAGSHAIWSCLLLVALFVRRRQGEALK